MEYKVYGNKIILRLARGEEIISSLQKLTELENIKCGRLSGIGASSDATVGVYDVNTKIYTKITHKEEMEILSLSGNITRKDGAPYIHAHITLGSLNNVYGGHLNEAFISATCEIIIDVINATVERQFDEETGLNLFKL